MSRVSVLFCAIALLSINLLSGCGGGANKTASGPTVSGGTLTGVVAKGPVSNATVTAYSVVNGAKSTAVGSSNTDSRGSYSIELGSYSGTVLLEATGGSYKDEATGVTTPLASTLRSGVPNATANVSASITAITEAAVQSALADAGGLSAANLQSENDNIKNQIGFDPVTTQPADATDATSANAAKDAKAYAAYLGSVSQYINNNPGKTPVSAAGDFAASFKSGGLWSNAAIAKAAEDFGANTNNQTGVANLAILQYLSVGLAVTTAHAHPTIVFDYSHDTNNFFTPQVRALMDSAAAVFTSRISGTKWARIDTSTAGGSYDLAFIDPSTLKVTWISNAVIPENQITIHVGAIDFTKAPITQMQSSSGDGASQLLSMRNVSGGVASVLTSSSQLRPIDASITFDLQGIKGFSSAINRQWYFSAPGSFPTDFPSTSDPHVNDYTDFWTTVIHEIGHVLGIYNPGVFNAVIESDPNLNLAWTSQVKSSGSGYTFTGPFAKQMYYNHVGQDIPLEAADKSHWATGVRSQTATGYVSVTHESDGQFRKTFSELEFQALRDLGYTVSTAP